MAARRCAWSRRAKRQRKPSPQILLNQGVILHALNRSEEALASSDAALKQKSKFAKAPIDRGAVLEALNRLPEALADSQFVFLHHLGGPAITSIVQERIEANFVAAGLDPADHCVFVERLSQNKFVATAGLADAFLDTIGWSACNSALESLTHDLPIVTLAGPMISGRHSAAIHDMLGVPDTVAASLDDCRHRHPPRPGPRGA